MTIELRLPARQAGGYSSRLLIYSLFHSILH